MNIIVRNEEPKDHRRTEEVAREAFWNLYFPGAAEHYVVHKMRSHPDFIQELAFVIEVDGTVEGAIFYTHSKGYGRNYYINIFLYEHILIISSNCSIKSCMIWQRLNTVQNQRFS